MTQRMDRWSGLAGIAGSVLFVVVFLFVGIVVGSDTSIDGFSAVRAGRTIENSLYLAVLLLWIAPFLALRRALTEASPGLAGYGSVVGVAGLVVLAIGALPHVASIPIADLHGTPNADRSALTAVWQGSQAIVNMLLVTGLVILPVGVIGLGMAMIGAPAFGPGIGRVSVALGAIGAVVAVVLLVDPLSPIAVLGFLALIGFQLVVGWRVYALSRITEDGAAWAPAATGRSAG